jgi:cobalt/nickel transport system permease protein
MHIPDGFLTSRLWLAFDAFSGAGVVYAARRLRLEVASPVVPLMGVLSAFVFAAQMLNFPILGGTSGHLVGGALVGILVGPLAGFLTMTTVVVAQALFLQDGGLAALGANVFNIAAVPVLAGYGTFRIAGGRAASGRRLVPPAFAAGWISLVASAVCCALELALSGAVPLGVGLPAMTGYHAVIGIAEGGLTAGAVAFLDRVRPDLLTRASESRLALVDWLAAAALVALPCALLVLAGSSSLPDPLQKLLSIGNP